MAGMRTFPLSRFVWLGILEKLLPASGRQSSQIAIAETAVVPLWKVIVGPRADELSRTRKGPVFLCDERRLADAVRTNADCTVVQPVGHSGRQR
jgi:hypothetical protein